MDSKKKKKKKKKKKADFYVDIFESFSCLLRLFKMHGVYISSTAARSKRVTPWSRLTTSKRNVQAVIERDRSWIAMKYLSVSVTHRLMTTTTTTCYGYR